MTTYETLNKAKLKDKFQGLKLLISVRRNDQVYLRVVLGTESFGVHGAFERDKFNLFVKELTQFTPESVRRMCDGN
jgi:hypothetical protein